jgi:pimeloyl-ACP methyl ester carboxylesterase
MSVQYLIRKGLPKLAYVHSPAPRSKYLPVVFLGGYRSDMAGTKAGYLEKQCRARGQEFLRLDYSGHGQSEGVFEDGTIGMWLNDALAVIDHTIKKPFIIVGSSMGGWMALLVARAKPERIKGLIGIAAAPDFSEELYANLTKEQQVELQATGKTAVPNDYSDHPYHVTKEFYDEAKRHLLLDKPINFPFPIHLIQGKKDNDVPWQTAERIRNMFGDVNVTYVEKGDHRLSTPSDLELIDAVVLKMSG